ncbi:major facilitator superfamily domain-containing protein [Lipomyces tetrasporus]|uniref:Major facilitator superfamily domain-containing protein n=1 Tax=Lipomyces tetrasporus TaxID=54092 RepID=A0AAD7R0V4_9ASCO|nr:major facilitator superfamily domain-containing protein [Lipomyces tetrasporus]KAJ8103622.1 major facilitator superfamily domain-containing protein [Lipomyces tetrasporus]
MASAIAQQTTQSWHVRLRRHLATRVSSLKPPSNAVFENPFRTLALLNRSQWLFFSVAFAGWTWDAFDFFTVSLTASEIAADLNRTVADITWGITLVLMLRSVGAIAFGLLADKYGRKWPFIANCVLFLVLELGTGFVQTYAQFLGVRALFGIAMGGIYGNCAATALEDCPLKARGIISGLLQQGYAFGYLLAVVFNRALTSTTAHGWRSLFWFGAGPPVLIIIFRMCLPETDAYKAQKQLERESRTGAFMQMAKASFKEYWHIMIYLVIIMAGFNFMSHGSQDLYPTMLSVQLEFRADRSTVTMCVANLGAITGGILFGHMSDFIGRRLSIMIACVLGGALIYPWAFVRNDGIMAAVFFLQFMVQGAWGVIPIFLSELSPPALRAFVVGLAYQLGNLASSASSTIEATIGARFPLDSQASSTVKRYDYAKVMAIFMGCVFGYVLVVTFLGPENRSVDMSVGSAFEKDVDEKDVDLEKGGDVQHQENRM